eukprot:Rmarinus@m.10423
MYCTDIAGAEEQCPGHSHIPFVFMQSKLHLAEGITESVPVGIIWDVYNRRAIYLFATVNKNFSDANGFPRAINGSIPALNVDEQEPTLLKYRHYMWCRSDNLPHTVHLPSWFMTCHAPPMLMFDGETRSPADNSGTVGLPNALLLEIARRVKVSDTRFGFDKIHPVPLELTVPPEYWPTVNVNPGDTYAELVYRVACTILVLCCRRPRGRGTSQSLRAYVRRIIAKFNVGVPEHEMIIRGIRKNIPAFVDAVRVRHYTVSRSLSTPDSHSAAEEAVLTVNTCEAFIGKKLGLWLDEQNLIYEPDEFVLGGSVYVDCMRILRGFAPSGLHGPHVGTSKPPRNRIELKTAIYYVFLCA